MTEPTNIELDAVIKHYRTRIYPQDMQPHFERAIMREVIAKWGAQPVPAWYALVPVEPSAEMVDAAQEAYMPFGDMQLAIQLAIAAAPQPVACEPLTDSQAQAGAVPMSHDEAKALVRKYGNDPLHLILQVERHHGIKGGQHGADT